MILKKNSYSGLNCWVKRFPRSVFMVFTCSKEFLREKFRSNHWVEGRRQNTICTRPREESSHWSQDI